MMDGNIVRFIVAAVLMFAVMGGISVLAQVYSLNNIKTKRLETDSMEQRAGQQKQKLGKHMRIFPSRPNVGVSKQRTK